MSQANTSTRHNLMAKGFTLIELLVTVAILGITLSMAVPAMGTFVEKNRVRGAVETLVSEFQFARTEAIKRNASLSLTFSENSGEGSAGTWCIGLDENPGCNCNITDAQDITACALMTAGSNVLKTVTSDSFEKVHLLQNFAGNRVTFNPVRGTVNAGTMTFQSPSGFLIQVQMSVLGRIHACSDNVIGYPEC